MHVPLVSVFVMFAGWGYSNHTILTEFHNLGKRGLFRTSVVRGKVVCMAPHLRYGGSTVTWRHCRTERGGDPKVGLGRVNPHRRDSSIVSSIKKLTYKCADTLAIAATIPPTV